MEPAKGKEEKDNDLSTISFYMELGKYLNSKESLDELFKIVKKKSIKIFQKLKKFF